MSDKATLDRIIEAADQLFYQYGYEYTSFADIADFVKISRGNFYHYFKSKDEILNAVIGQRLANTQRMLGEWEAQESKPKDRILCYIRILFTNGDKIKRYGCPVGTLTTELAKLNHASKVQANKIFTLFKEWLSKQFALLGFKKDEADELAMHVLSWSQGVATMFNAFTDKKFVEWEVQHMEDWIKQVAKKEHFIN
jgi:AcrR family transcriptional regulator